jgi:hypothetical protein
MKINTYMSPGGILPHGFIERMRRIVGKEHFSQKEEDLISYSLDYWLYGVFLSQKGELPALPSAVISPASTAQIQEIVKCAREYHALWWGLWRAWWSNSYEWKRYPEPAKDEQVPESGRTLIGG